MKKRLKSTTDPWVLASCISILAGILLIFFPTTALRAVCYLFGGALFVVGAGNVLSYVLNLLGKEAYQYSPQYKLVFGIVMVGLSILAFVKTTWIVSVIPVLLGVIIVVSGIVKLQHALDLRWIGYDGWLPILFLAAMSLILGGVMLFNPFDTAKTLIIAIGIGLVISGCTDLITNVCLKKQVKAYQDLLNQR